MTYIDEMIKELCPDGVEWKELGKVCVVKTGQSVNKTFIQNNSGDYPVINSGKQPLGYVDVFNTEDDPIGITSRGAGVGYVSWNEGKYFRGNLNYSATVKDSEKLLPRYLYYFLKNNSKKIEELCTFDGIPALNKSKLEKLNIAIPHEDIQKEIVKILDKFTDYVTELTAELTAELTFRQKQYSFYRDRLLSFEDQVYQVEWKTLGEVFDIVAGGDVPKDNFSERQTDRYLIPILSNGIEEKSLYGWTNIPKVDKPSLTVSARGTIGWTSYREKPFYPIVRLLVLTPKIELNLRYAYHFMKSIEDKYDVPQSGIPQLTKPMIKDKSIPLPSLATQARIVQVLDNFDAVCNDLNIGLPKEIELCQKQYEFFRDKLLTFTAEGVYTDSTVQYRQDLIRLLTWVFGPIRVELEAVAGYSTQKVSTDSLTPSNYVGVDNLLQNKAGKVKAAYLPSHRNVNIYDKEDILIGNIRPYLKKIWFATNSGGASPDVLVVQNQVKTCLDSRFLYHILATDKFFEFNMQNAKGSKMPRGDKKANLSYCFVLPLLSEQSHIVSILDKFDTLTTDISQGLPAEIEQRQKQYEYWRERLLSF